MKLLSKFLCSLLILLALALVVAYVMLQTPHGATWLSEQLSQRSGYQIAIANVSHNPLNPTEIQLHEVRLSRDETSLLDANTVTLKLNWQTLTHPRQWQQIRLQDGEIRLPAILQAQSQPLLQARQLLLRDMAISAPLAGRLLMAHPVSGGITPFIPGTGGWLGDDSRFEFTTPSLTYGELELQHLLLRGRWQDGRLSVQDMGADLLQGQISARGERSPEGQWSLRDLRLTRLRLQDNRLPDVLRRLWQQLPPLFLHNVELVDARLEGDDWSANDLDISAENLQLGQGQLHSSDGRLSMNALDLIYRDVHLRDPVLKLTFTPEGITLDDVSTRFENGLLRTYGRWNAAQHSLQLDDVGVSGIEYTLPEHWLAWLTQPLPSWLQRLNILRLELNNNLLIDIRPRFPFQFTALTANGSNLELIRAHKWGLWQGSLRINSRNATVNKVDLRHVMLDLQAKADTVTLHDFSAFSGQGLWEGHGELQQQGLQPLHIQLDGQQILLDSVQRFGWRDLPLRGLGNVSLQVDTTLQAPAEGVRPLTGKLNIDAEQALLQNIAPEQLLSAIQTSASPAYWLASSYQEGQMLLLHDLQLHLNATQDQVLIQHASAKGPLAMTLQGSLGRSTPVTQVQLVLNYPTKCQTLNRHWQSAPAGIINTEASAVSESLPLQSTVGISVLPECAPHAVGNTKYVPMNSVHGVSSEIN